MQTKFINAAGGFTGSFWEVDTKDGPKVVYALSNYDAAEAAGQRFRLGTVRSLKLVQEEGNT